MICPNCGSVEFYTGSNSTKCIPCHRVYSRKYRTNNTKKHKETLKQFHINNPDYQRNYRKKWKEKHPEQEVLHSKTYWINNPDKIALRFIKRKRALNQAIPKWYEDDLVKQVYLKRDELNIAWNTDFVVDHIIPLQPRDKSVCGLHCWANLQLIQDTVNSSKNDKYTRDW